MATMIPKDIDQFKTEGEKKFYRFLESVAKPDQKYTIWYLPDLGGREPDFILLGNRVGLVIFEVKDWELDQFLDATPANFVLMMGDKKENRKHPLLQAKEYLTSLMGRIKADGRLLSKHPDHYGNPRVPIDCGVVFPNINKYQYKSQGWDKAINSDKIFFSDDLHYASNICSDLTGNSFSKALVEMFPPKFRFKLAGTEYDHLKQLLDPEVEIKLPDRKPCPYLDQLERIKVLDDNQEAFARNYCSGYRIIKGPSGSGKTLILVHKAAFLSCYQPEIKNILFLCYNITLVNYIKQLLTRKGIAVGQGDVEVYHFYELCSRILGEEIDDEKEGDDYYQLVEEETHAKLRSNPKYYDAVLVDEGQDFRKKMAEIVFLLVDPKRPNLTVAVDDGQNIYSRDATWNPPGQDKFRLDEISGMYRNSAEIRRFALTFLKKGGKSDFKGHSVHCETHGPKPKLRSFKNYDRLLTFVAETIKILHDQGEYPLSEFAVLYTKRSLVLEQKASAPELIMAALESRGIMSQWVSEDNRAKRAYDITIDKVSISTIHSAKGLDYACVFLLGLDVLRSANRSEEESRKLVYVGITRARHRLYIPYIQRTALIAELISCL